MKIKIISVMFYYALTLIAAVSIYKRLTESDWISVGISTLVLFLFARAMFKTHTDLAQKEFVNAVKEKIEKESEGRIANFSTAKEKSDESE